MSVILNSGIGRIQGILTQIGKYTEGGGCDVSYNREIIDYKRQNKIVYAIKVGYTGMFAMLVTNMNWALIPKLKDNYRVEFIV